MVLALVCSSFLASSPTWEPDKPLVPWFVPRTASFGVFINPPMVSPHLRLGWEAAILSQPRNELIWVFNLGTGGGVGVPTPMVTHWQHTVLGGFGYRSDRPVFHWGFHFAAGPLWYLANYLPGAFNKFESRVVGYIEGRLQAGVRLAPHFRLAAYFGYASPFVFNAQFPGNTFVGGFDAGVVLDWR